MADNAEESDDFGEIIHILAKHETVLCEELRQQWHKGQYCDMIIRLGLGKSITVHSCVIAAFSVKISNFLRGEKYKILSLVDFSHEACYCIIESLYTGVLHFQPGQIREVLRVASYFELKDIEAFCKQNLENSVTAHLLTISAEKSQPVQDEMKIIESFCMNAMDIIGKPKALKNDSNSSVAICENNQDHDIDKSASYTLLDMDFKTLGKNCENVQELPEPKSKLANIADINNKDQPMKRTETKYLLRKSISPGGDRNFVYKDWTSGDSDVGCYDGDTEPATEEKSTESQDVDKVCVVTIKSSGSAPNKMYLTKSDLQKGKKKAGSAKRKAFTQIRRRRSSGNKVKKECTEVKMETSPTSTLNCDEDNHNFGLEVMKKDENLDSEAYSSCEDDEFGACSEKESPTLVGPRTRSKVFKKKKIPCPKCPRKFSKKTNLDQHMKAHEDGLAHTCQLCHSSYARLCDFTRHVRSHDDGERFRCSYCDKMCENRQILVAHSQSEHDDDKPFKCIHPNCTFATYKYYYLADHQLIHREEKSYVCPTCGKGFSQSGGLISHSRSCLQTQSYLCDLCGQTFNHLGSMKTHRRVHLGEKPYSCEECDSRFSDHRNLKRHMRIHENLFPYECDVCHKHFRHSNSLKAHAKQHNQPLEEAEALCSLSQLYKSFNEGNISHQSHDLQIDQSNCEDVNDIKSQLLDKTPTNDSNTPLNLIKDSANLDKSSDSQSASAFQTVSHLQGLSNSNEQSENNQKHMYNHSIPNQNDDISGVKRKEFYPQALPIREENSEVSSQFYGHPHTACPSRGEGDNGPEGDKDLYRQVISQTLSGEVDRSNSAVQSQYYSQPVFSRNERNQFFEPRSSLAEVAGIERSHFYSGLHQLPQSNPQFLLQPRSMLQMDADERNQFYVPQQSHSDDIGMLSVQMRSASQSDRQNNTTDQH